jgi:hypothetical protein
MRDTDESKCGKAPKENAGVRDESTEDIIPRWTSSFALENMQQQNQMITTNDTFRSN